MNRKVRRVLQALVEINKAVEVRVDEGGKGKKPAPLIESAIALEVIPERFRELIRDWNLSKDEQAQISVGVKKRYSIVI